ncbi:MAG: hypothetical protein A2511_09170, partial [Deltaproteobacteria bacterium RIFOXYD12_FULL_50_9]
MEDQLTLLELEQISQLLSGGGAGSSGWLAASLPGCGSDRRFFRVTRLNQAGLLVDGRESLIAVLPQGREARNIAEARSSCLIGGHLYDRGVAVPRIFGFEPASGLLVFEDLGDCRLYDLLSRQSPASSEVVNRYDEALQALVQFQITGRPGFREEMCWDTPRYDQQLMLERESLYFAREFCRDMLGFPEPSDELLREFEELAVRVSREPADYLLHRDYQSQNLMIHGNRIRIVDFQGARLGPLGYDLASLLNDPYAGLPDGLKENLLDRYIELLQQYIAVDVAQFREGYYY